jgi:DNA-binding XRE family transcriptional regulator
MKVNETQLYSQIGKRIKQRRIELGMTQTQLAETIGVLRTSITNIEAGRQKAPLHMIYQLCIVLSVEVATILPTKAEVTQPTTDSLKIEGEIEQVPPKAAEFLQQLLEE